MARRADMPHWLRSMQRSFARLVMPQNTLKQVLNMCCRLQQGLRHVAAGQGAQHFVTMQTGLSPRIT